MGKIILIVIDFERIRDFVQKALQKKGYKVLASGKGLDALKYLDGDKIDLLIIDNDMPNLSGVELIKKIRKKPVYEFTSIILLTSADNTENNEEINELKIGVILRKPFDIVRFYSYVEKAIGNRKRE